MMNWLKKRLAKWAIKYLCKEEGHAWIEDGGRNCPYSEITECSQAVYRCARCLTYDYGYEGGPGWESCGNCDLKSSGNFKKRLAKGFVMRAKHD